MYSSACGPARAPSARPSDSLRISPAGSASKTAQLRQRGMGFRYSVSRPAERDWNCEAERILGCTSRWHQLQICQRQANTGYGICAPLAPTSAGEQTKTPTQGRFAPLNGAPWERPFGLVVALPGPPAVTRATPYPVETALLGKFNAKYENCLSKSRCVRYRADHTHKTSRPTPIATAEPLGSWRSITMYAA